MRAWILPQRTLLSGEKALLPSVSGDDIALSSSEHGATIAINSAVRILGDFDGTRPGQDLPQSFSAFR